jgi:hypothetical protein
VDLKTMLSDARHEFLRMVTAAAARLQIDVEHYSGPPFAYPAEEISELSRACEAVVSSVSDAPWKPDAMLGLVMAAYLTLKQHDAPWISDESTAMTDNDGGGI